MGQLNNLYSHIVVYLFDANSNHVLNVGTSKHYRATEGICQQQRIPAIIVIHRYKVEQRDSRNTGRSWLMHNPPTSLTQGTVTPC